MFCGEKNTLQFNPNKSINYDWKAGPFMETAKHHCHGFIEILCEVTADHGMKQGSEFKVHNVNSLCPCMHPQLGCATDI